MEALRTTTKSIRCLYYGIELRHSHLFELVVIKVMSRAVTYMGFSFQSIGYIEKNVHNKFNIDEQDTLILKIVRTWDFLISYNFYFVRFYRKIILNTSEIQYVFFSFHRKNLGPM